MKPQAKAVLIAVILFVSLDLYGRWTGQSFQLDLLRPNQLGAAIKRAQAAGGVA